jgi:hypothetical protein
MSKQNIEMKLQPVGLLEVALQTLQKLREGNLSVQISTDIDTDNISRSLDNIADSIDKLTNAVYEISSRRSSK